jgi:glycosyltransferase involved in cell wall biosynthesis
MPRVLLVFEYPTLNGGEQSLLTILPIVRQADFEVLALAPLEGELADALSALGVEISPFAPCGRTGETLPQARRREDLAAAMRRLRPDLLHANSLAMSRLAGPVAVEVGVPSIGHVRDMVSLSRQAIHDLNRHTRLLAVSEATRAWHVAQGMDAGKMFVCYNGVDLDRFRPRPPTGFLHPELALPPTVTLVGTIGQLVLRKGVDVACEAMARLMPNCPDLHWIVVGERFSQKAEALDYERQLREAAARPPLAGRVHFLGVRRDVHLLMNEFTLLLHAARQEPLGRVILEAASAGLPLVATDVGGTAEIVPRDQFVGLLTPADDPAALAAAVASLLHDPAHRRRLAAGLRRRAEAAFAARDAAQRLVGHYDDLLPWKLS